MSDGLKQEINFTEAQEAYAAGDYLKSAHLFMEAEIRFSLIGEKIRAGEMANNASVSFLQAGESKKSLQVLDGYIDLFENLGEIRHLAFTLGNRAASLEALGRLEDASKDFHTAALLFSQIGEQELFTITKQSLSALQIRAGSPIEALATMKSGLSDPLQSGLKNRLLKKILDIPFRLLNVK
jgi:tetratricopeptide (TPR) repeat protein